MHSRPGRQQRGVSPLRPLSPCRARAPLAPHLPGCRASRWPWLCSGGSAAQPAARLSLETPPGAGQGQEQPGPPLKSGCGHGRPPLCGRKRGRGDGGGGGWVPPLLSFCPSGCGKPRGGEAVSALLWTLSGAHPGEEHPSAPGGSLLGGEELFPPLTLSLYPLPLIIPSPLSQLGLAQVPGSGGHRCPPRSSQPRPGCPLGDPVPPHVPPPQPGGTAAPRSQPLGTRRCRPRRSPPWQRGSEQRCARDWAEFAAVPWEMLRSRAGFRWREEPGCPRPVCLSHLEGLIQVYSCTKLAESPPGCLLSFLPLPFCRSPRLHSSKAWGLSLESPLFPPPNKHDLNLCKATAEPEASRGESAHLWEGRAAGTAPAGRGEPSSFPILEGTKPPAKPQGKETSCSFSASRSREMQRALTMLEAE